MRTFFSEIISIFVTEINIKNELTLEKTQVENREVHKEESLFKKEITTMRLPYSRSQTHFF